MSKRIRIAVSRCLLGDPVRYDGQHKRSAAVVDVLGGRFDFEPICPEVEAGLGVPRPPIRLVEVGGRARVREVERPHRDVTDELEAAIAAGCARLAGVRGLVLKARSPSCGLRGVPRFDESGDQADATSGRLTASLRLARPDLPRIEGWELEDPAVRDAWIEQVLAYRP